MSSCLVTLTSRSAAKEQCVWELPGPQRNSSLRPGVLRFGMHRTELWRSHHTQTLFALTEHLIRTTVTVCCTTPLVSIVALITDLVVTARSFVSEQCHSTDTRSRHRETHRRFADTLARKCSTRRPHPRWEITWEPGVYSSNKATPAARDTQLDPAVRYAHIPGEPRRAGYTCARKSELQQH